MKTYAKKCGEHTYKSQSLGKKSIIQRIVELCDSIDSR